MPANNGIVDLCDILDAIDMLPRPLQSINTYHTKLCQEMWRTEPPEVQALVEASTRGNNVALSRGYLLSTRHHPPACQSHPTLWRIRDPYAGDDILPAENKTGRI